MADRLELARLRIRPASWGAVAPIQVHTVRLVGEGEEFRIETTEQTDHKRKRWWVTVSPGEATRQLDLLRKATVPAFPVSPLVCDGEYVELTIHGKYSDLTLGWWTMAPWGADALANFADWLRKLGLPGEEDDNDRQE